MNSVQKKLNRVWEREGERNVCSMHIHAWEWLSGYFLAKAEVQVVDLCVRQHIFGFYFKKVKVEKFSAYLWNAASWDDRLWVVEFLLFQASPNLVSQKPMERVASIQKVTSWFYLFVSFRWHRVASYDS